MVVLFLSRSAVCVVSVCVVSVCGVRSAVCGLPSSAFYGLRSKFHVARNLSGVPA